MCVGCHAHHGRVNFRLSLLSLDPFGAKACLRTPLPTGLLYEPSGARTTFFGTGGERTPAGKKFRKFFLGGGRILERFFGVATEFSERQGGLGAWKTPRGVQNGPFSRDYGPDFPRQWATTAPVLPHKTLVLATMLWNGVDGLAVFPRALARDLRAGGRVG